MPSKTFPSKLTTSKVGFLTKLCFAWIENLIDYCTPKVTKHRADVPPWTSKKTSHLMKKTLDSSRFLKLKRNGKRNSRSANGDLLNWNLPKPSIQQCSKLSTGTWENLLVLLQLSLSNVHSELKRTEKRPTFWKRLQWQNINSCRLWKKNQS